MENFSIKLKILKNELKTWNRNIYGNIYVRANSISKIMQDLEADLQNHWNEDTWNELEKKKQSLRKSELELKSC